MKLEEIVRYTKEHPFECILRYDFSDDIYTLSGLLHGEFEQQKYDELMKNNIYENVDNFLEHLIDCNVFPKWVHKGFGKFERFSLDTTKLSNKENIEYFDLVEVYYVVSERNETYNRELYLRTNDGQIIELLEDKNFELLKYKPFGCNDYEYDFRHFSLNNLPCPTKGFVRGTLNFDFMEWSKEIENKYYTFTSWNRCPDSDYLDVTVGKVGDVDYSYIEGVVEEGSKTYKKITHHSSLDDALEFILQNFAYDDGTFDIDTFTLSYPEDTVLSDEEKRIIDNFVDEQNKILEEQREEEIEE